MERRRKQARTEYVQRCNPPNDPELQALGFYKMFSQRSGPFTFESPNDEQLWYGVRKWVESEKANVWFQASYKHLSNEQLRLFSKFHFGFPAAEELHMVDGLDLLPIMRKERVDFTPPQIFKIERAQVESGFSVTGEAFQNLLRDLGFSNPITTATFGRS